MPPYDADETGRVETTSSEAMTAVVQEEIDGLERARRHLRAALSTTEPKAETFHVRQALQLLTIEDR